jgi:hypothetical protein
LGLATSSVLSAANRRGVNKEVLRKHLAKMIVGAMGFTVTEADWQDSNPPFTIAARMIRRASIHTTSSR